MTEMLLAAPASGSGKTAVTCGMLALLKQKGKDPCAFKCGPDYIDPMFHRAVLGVESHNLDLYLAEEAQVRRLYHDCRGRHGSAVCEGVMGLYDGVGGTTVQASAWHVADTLDLPVILVLRPKGASLTLAAQIRGLAEFRQPSHVAGVILNDCSELLYRSLADVLERETGVPLLGYLPHMEEARFESRHLGLYTAQEIGDLDTRIRAIAARMEQTIDMERLENLCSREAGVVRQHFSQIQETPSIPAQTQETEGVPVQTQKVPDIPVQTQKTAPIPAQKPEQPVRIAVARDEAFCFFYEESLEAFRQAGAELVEFSPVHDSRLPENIHGLYLTGGYPELYLRELSDNRSMRDSVAAAVRGGMPTVAECGGFLYLGQRLSGAERTGTVHTGILQEEGGAGAEGSPMCGVLPGSGVCRERLVRFGYSALTAKKDSLLFRAGEEIPVHEFHYWDSTDNGQDLHAVKPVSGRSWDCGFATDTLYAGFPHLYFAGHPQLTRRFLAAAGRYRDTAAAGRQKGHRQKSETQEGKGEQTCG